MPDDHVIFDGRVHVYKRDDSRYWQCSAFINDKNFRVSTKEDSLSRAKDFAEDWYLELRGKHKRGELKDEKTFNQAADKFLEEYPIITEGHRNKMYVKGHEQRLSIYLRVFFGDIGLSQITAGKLQEYRIWRRQKHIDKWGKAPARNTVHQEIVTLRQTLKTAVRHGWLTHLPDLSEPYKTKGKLGHRAWFSPEEYKALYEATRARSEKPKKKRFQWESNQLHDYVLFMANTGLRPDEAKNLEFRDVTIIDDEDTEETILLIEVRGKRGVGYCKSTAGAVFPFTRLKERERMGLSDPSNPASAKKLMKPRPNDKVFPNFSREMFNAILDELNFKQDRQGNARTAYSLRHTYICLRLMEGADIYQIAKNCRTSVEMIENNYAKHIKTSLDAAAINVRKKRNKNADKPSLEQRDM